jgi:UDP-N-acetyl-D-galactosamine dehydrogenase
VENSQRDINIAFMNELAVIFDRMGIDTNEVVDGMDTK